MFSEERKWTQDATFKVSVGSKIFILAMGVEQWSEFLRNGKTFVSGSS